MLPACEEILKPPVIAHEAVDNTSAGAHDLRGQQDDHMQKAPKLPWALDSKPVAAPATVFMCTGMLL